MTLFVPLQSGYFYTGEILLFQLLNANFQLTSDQFFQRMFSGAFYNISSILGRQRSGSGTAVSGGIYDQANKTGNVIVSSVQSWTPLAPGAIVTTSSAITNVLFTNTPFLSLSVGSSSALTADVLIYGHDLT